MGKEFVQPWPELEQAKKKCDRYAVAALAGSALAIVFIILGWNDVVIGAVLGVSIFWPQARFLHLRGVVRTLRKHRTAIRAYEQLHGDGV